MLSFGSAAYLKNKKLISTFKVNIECFEGAVADPDTGKWWSSQIEAWNYCRSNFHKPETAMKSEYRKTTKGLMSEKWFDKL